MPSAFATVGLIGKYNSPEIAAPLLRLGAFLSARGVRVIVDRLAGEHITGSPYPVFNLEDIGREADLAVVLGGDGTMLNIARTFAPHDVALVGVNQGRLGFLTDISTDTMFDTIGAILDGSFVTEERMLLEAQIVAAGVAGEAVLAFNDVVIGKGQRGNMIEFEIRIDGQFIANMRADGLILATPTGSTAYALSAGGPIVHPSLSAIALVPVCPHTLSNRPLVVPSGSVIEIVMTEVADARAHFDSHAHYDLRDGDCVRVRRYDHTIRLLHPVGHSYYAMLREKLGWSGSFQAARRDNGQIS
ncbi:MAG: NAD kinase [Burkholderiales bacterium]